jgi:hypothetical protein
MPQGFELLMLVLLMGTLGLIPAVFMALWIADKVSTHRARRVSLPIEAIILSQRVIERTDAHNFTAYFPHVEYKYSINGTDYTSSTIWSGGVSEFEFPLRQVEQLLEKFPTGQTVQAFCDPDDPEKSFLIRKHPAPGNWIATFIAWFMFLMFFGGVWASGLLLPVMGVMVLTVAGIAGWILWRTRNVTEESSDG